MKNPLVTIIFRNCSSLYVLAQYSKTFSRNFLLWLKFGEMTLISSDYLFIIAFLETNVSNIYQSLLSSPNKRITENYSLIHSQTEPKARKQKIVDEV